MPKIDMGHGVFIDWSGDYEVTDHGRRRLELYREKGIPKSTGNQFYSRLYESVNLTFLEGLDRGDSIKDLRESLFYIIPKSVITEEKFPRLLEIVLYNLIVMDMVVEVDSVEDLQ